MQWQKDVPEKSQDRVSVGMSGDRVRDPSLPQRVEALPAVTGLEKLQILALFCTDYMHKHIPYFGERSTSNAVRSIQVLPVWKW